MSEAVKAGAANISAESLKVAETAKAVAASQADLRRAWVLSKDASIPAAESMSYLAAAQQRLAAAQAEAAAATKAAAGEMAASAEPVAAAWGVAGMEIRAALTGVQEKLVQTAETSKLSAEGIGAGFAGLGTLMGAGILVGFAAHFLDDTSKMILQLGILSEKTGISVTALAGLRQVAKESGEDFDAMGTGLTRMLRAMAMAAAGAKPSIKAFTDLGISASELPGLLHDPEAMLYRVARGMAETHTQAIRVNSAITLFGRGGSVLIPILEKQGAAMKDNVDTASKLTGVTNESLEASRRWAQETARLSAMFQRVMIPALEHVEDVVADLIGGIEVAASIIITAFEAVGTAIVSTFAPLFRLGVLMKDIFTGNWAALKSDVEKMSSAFTDTWIAGFKDIEQHWKDAVSSFRWSKERPLPAAENTGEGEPGPGAIGAGGKGAKDGKPEKPGLSNLESITATVEKLELAKTVWDLAVAKQQQAAIGAFMKEAVKLDEDATKHIIEAYRNGAEEKIRIGRKDLEEFEEQCRFKVRMGEMSEKQMLASTEAAAKKEETIRRQQFAVIEALDRNDVKRYEEDLKKEEEAAREFAKKITQIHQQAALKFKENWDKAANQFNTAFTTAFNQIITGSKSISQAFSMMFNKIILDVADMVLKWLLKEAEKWAMLRIMQATGLTTKHVVDAASNVATVTGDASVAAAGAMAYYSAINPPMAPGMAALAFAETMAYAGGAVADLGGLIPHKGLAVNLSGAAERVLDPRQTANFDKMVNQSNSSSNSSTTHNHITQNMNGYDRAGMKAALRGHADEILDIVRGGYRSGALTA